MKSGALWVHCRGLALADFGRDPPSSDSWRERGEFFLWGKRFHRFPVSQISLNLTATRRSVSRWKFSEQNFENFTAKGRFPKNAKISGKFLTSWDFILRWLSIAVYSLPNWSSTGCLVFIFTVRINSKSFPWLYAPYRKRTYPNFRQRPMSDIAY